MNIESREQEYLRYKHFKHVRWMQIGGILVACLCFGIVMAVFFGNGGRQQAKPARPKVNKQKPNKVVRTWKPKKLSGTYVSILPIKDPTMRTYYRADVLLRFTPKKAYQQIITIKRPFTRRVPKAVHAEAARADNVNTEDYIVRDAKVAKGRVLKMKPETSVPYGTNAISPQSLFMLPMASTSGGADGSVTLRWRPKGMQVNELRYRKTSRKRIKSIVKKGDVPMYWLGYHEER